MLKSHSTTAAAAAMAPSTSPSSLAARLALVWTFEDQRRTGSDRILLAHHEGERSRLHADGADRVPALLLRFCRDCRQFLAVKADGAIIRPPARTAAFTPGIACAAVRSIAVTVAAAHFERRIMPQSTPGGCTS